MIKAKRYYGLNIYALMLASLVLSAPSFAETWKFWPRLSVGGGYIDDVVLVQNSDSAIQYSGYGLMEAARLTERGESIFGVGVDFNKYETNQPDLEEDERLFGHIDTNYRVTERSKFLFNMAYVEDLISADSASSLDGSDAITDTDIGFLTTQAKRETFSVTPRYETAINERVGLAVEYSYIDRGYDENILISDSQQHVFGMEGTMTLTERYAAFVEINGGVFETELDDEVKGYTALFGVNHQYSDIARLSYGIGYNSQDTSTNGQNGGPIVDEKKSIVTGRVTWNLQGERSNFDAIIQRTQRPSASGNFVVADLYSLSGAYGLTERTGISIQLRYFDNESKVTNNSGRDNRTFFTVSPTFRWRFSEHWFFDLRYTYNDQDRENDSDNFSNNSILLGVSYKPNKSL